MNISRRGLMIGAGALGVSAIPMPSFAQSIVTGGALSPPSNGSFLLPVIAGNSLDKKYDLDFKLNFYNDQSILYSDFAANKTGFIISAIFAGANLYARGMDARLLFTYCTQNSAIVSKNPAIKTFADLKGKNVYATTSSGYYGLTALCLQKEGFDLRRDINLINAPPAGVRTNLVADKADAGMMFDPALSDMLSEGFHLVDDINAKVRQALGLAPDATLWGSGVTAHQSWLDEDNTRAERLLNMCQDAIKFIKENPDDADKLISEFTKLPVKSLKASRDLKISEWRIGLPQPERKNLDTLFGAFHAGGFLEKLPGDDYYYNWGA